MSNKYQVKCEVDSNVGDFLKGSELRLSKGSVLKYQSNKWEVSNEITAESTEEAKNKGIESINDELVLASLFLPIGTSDTVLFRIKADTCTVTALGTDKTTIFSNTATVVVYERLEASTSVKAWSPEAIQDFVSRSADMLPAPEESNIRVPFHYYLRALTEVERVYRFLNFMICLDAVVGYNRATTRLKLLRAAIILGHDFPDKQNTYNALYYIYKVRNKIVHGSKVPDLNDNTINQLAGYVRPLLRNYLILMEKYADKGRVFDLVDGILNRANEDEIYTTVKAFLGV